MSKIDLDLRPASYWDHTGPVSAILSNIKGQNRRNMVREFVTGRARAEFGEIPAGFFEPDVDEEVRTHLGRAHPSWMGGEYLPDYLPGEVEIARLVLDSTTQDVISVRARHRRTRKRIFYRVVDEYPMEGFAWTCRPASSAHPLTLRQLIRLIDGARNLNFAGQRGPLPLLFMKMQEGCEPEELVNFVTVESDFYPDITKHYQRQARLWLKRASRQRSTGE